MFLPVTVMVMGSFLCLTLAHAAALLCAWCLLPCRGCGSNINEEIRVVAFLAPRRLTQGEIYNLYNQQKINKFCSLERKSVKRKCCIFSRYLLSKFICSNKFILICHNLPEKTIAKCKSLPQSMSNSTIENYEISAWHVKIYLQVASQRKSLAATTASVPSLIFRYHHCREFVLGSVGYGRCVYCSL